MCWKSNHLYTKNQDPIIYFMGPVEIVFVDSKKVSCDGTKGLSSHPLVYLNMGEKDHVICPYCSKHFTTKKAGSTDFLKDLNRKKS